MHNVEVSEATDFLENVFIPSFAKVFSFFSFLFFSFLFLVFFLFLFSLFLNSL